MLVRGCRCCPVPGSRIAWCSELKANPPRYQVNRNQRAYAAELHEGGRSVLVQPGGSGEETVLIFIGGAPSHAFIKQDTLIQAEPDFEIWDIGAAALAAAAAEVSIDVGEVLYARAHVVGDRREPRLLELQLVEPSLGWQRLDAATRDHAQHEFALGVESACERLGLGSFRQPGSH